MSSHNSIKDTIEKTDEPFYRDHSLFEADQQVLWASLNSFIVLTTFIDISSQLTRIDS